MRKYFLLFIIVICAFSCKDRVNSEEGHGYHFYPRNVTYLIAMIGKQITKYSYDGLPYTEYEVLKDDVVRKDEWSILFSVTNCNPDTLQDIKLYYNLLDTPILEVERLLARDYENTFFKQSSSGLRSSGGDAFNFIDIEYRTNVVVNLSIYALKTTMFGKPAGESLNDSFDIVSYDPAIISTPNYNLIYGYADQKSINMPIDEWLSLRPLAQTGMNLAPNKQINGLPVNVQFVVEMETDEGLLLRDTTQLITITE